jgi:glycerol-3-phosphate dehydrogenase subunit C
MAPLADKLISTPGSLARKLITRITGVSAVRRLPTYAAQRFSTWSRSRQKIHAADRQGSVTVFPTCLVEYLEPGIGKDLVRVYERNGVDCAVSEAGCCGAPWLHAGDIERFTKVATRNVTALAAEVRRGTDIVVAQPSCCYVLTTDYLDHVGGPVADYLMRLHRGEDSALDTEFPGEVVEHVTYHVPCHLRALQIGLPGRDLLQLTGARVKLVQQCSGVDGLWSLRAENDAIAIPVAEELGSQIERAGGDVIAGDCHLANTVILEQTGRAAQHPIQVLARSYGILQE